MSYYISDVEIIANLLAYSLISKENFTFLHVYPILTFTRTDYTMKSWSVTVIPAFFHKSGTREGNLTMISTFKEIYGSYPLKKWDIALLFFFILLSFMPPLYFHLTQSPAEGDKVIIVEKDGKEIFRHPLDESMAHEIQFPFIHNGEPYEGNLEMKDGAVKLHRLPEEIVPLSIHEDMGWISESYEVIVALPVKMVVRISSSEVDEVDITT